MSHFSVLVVGNDIEAALQPFHEFECTGTDDQYVQDVDQTEEARSTYENDTTTRVKGPDGVFYGTYDKIFYRDPTPEERSKLGLIPGSGCCDGFSYDSRDWGDGKGYRPKIHSIPDGYIKEEIPTKDVQSFRDFCADYYGRKAVLEGAKVDTEDSDFKYGYVLVNSKGEVTKVVDRTNPNSKWDWWKIGGRFSNQLLLKNGVEANTAKVGEVDFAKRIAMLADRAANKYDLIKSVINGRPIITWAELITKSKAGEITIDAAREQYNSQPILKELQDAKALDIWDGSEILSAVMKTSRDQYIKSESETRATTWAMVVDGRWLERGTMSWWAMSDATDESTKNYVTNYHMILRDLPPDTVITVVDCHI